MTRRVPFVGALVSDTVALLGSRLTMLALPWFVLTTGGSATQTGLVAAAQMAPMVLVKAVSGPLIDRVGPRRVAIAGDLGSVPVLAAVPVLHHAGWLSFPGLLLLVALSGALSGPADAAKAAMTPELARVAGLSLERATGLSGAVERTASMAGIGLAGALVALVGAADALLVNAATFAVSCLVITWCTRGLGARSEDHERTRYATELRSGWDFLRRDPVLLGMSVMVAVTNLVDLAFAAVWLPVWVRGTGHGVGVLSALMLTMLAASAAGAVVAAGLADRLPRFATYVVAFLLTGAPRMLAFALGAPLWVLFATQVVAGFASGFINPILGAVIYERIPTHLLGRVGALNTAFCYALMPLGGLLGGLAASHLGISPALVIGAGVYLIATMAPLVVPSFREFDRRPEPAPDTGPGAGQSSDPDADRALT